jgi:hypothetical protein
MSKYKKWSREEDLVISRMRAEGKTVKEIAEALNRNVPGVANHIWVLINKCELEKLTRNQKRERFKEQDSKIDYDEVARRIENGGLGNIQACLRQYAKETGCNITTLHKAYYNESQTKLRIKDRVNAFTTITPKGYIKGAKKITNEPISKNVGLWTKLKSWLSTLLLS